MGAVLIWCGCGTDTLQVRYCTDTVRYVNIYCSLLYQELSLASHNKEKRLAYFRKGQQYQQVSGGLLPRPLNRKTVQPKGNGPESVITSETRKCYLCHKAGHLARDCKCSRTECSGRRDP